MTPLTTHIILTILLKEQTISQTMMSRQYTTPLQVDILGGRGGKAFNHSGNKLLRATVSHRLDAYCKPIASRRQRSAIVTEILDSLESQGGRFLKYDGAQGEWYDAGYKEARLKISHAFRDASIPDKVKCIDRMRDQIEQEPAPSPVSLAIVQELTLSNFRTTFCTQECVASSLTRPSTDTLQSGDDLEPLSHNSAPRVSITFASFTGEDSPFGVLDDFLDNADDELISDVLNDFRQQ